MQHRRAVAIGVGGVTLAVAAALVVACSGDQGPSGTPGAPGEVGPAGAAGAAGPAGASATAGDAAAGAQGSAGEAGAPGIVISTTARHGFDISPVPISTAGLTSGQVEAVGNGSYIVNALTDCAACHGEQPGQYMAGGTAFGPVLSRNLTPDPTTGMQLTSDQFIAVMRTGADFHGVADGGTAQHTLIVMPWLTFRWMTDSDLQSIWLYLRSIPAVKNAVAADPPLGTPPPGPAPVAYTAGDQTGADGGAAAVPLPPAAAPDPGNVLRGLALNPLSEVDPSGLDVSTQSLFGRGSYLVNAISDCSGCHTNVDNAQTGKVDTAAYLTGGMVFATPVPKVMATVRAASANLIGSNNGFFNNQDVSFETFETLLTQGIHAEDHPPAPLAFPMPWQQFGNMELADQQAIYVYMTTVAAQYGATPTDKLIPDPALYCDSTDTTVHACPPGSACSITTGPGECLASSCATDVECGACQQCVGGTCKTLPATADGGPSVASCIAAGY